jgi:hypothetical protein
MIIKRGNTCTVEQLRKVLEQMEADGHGQVVVDLGKYCNDATLTTLVGAHGTSDGKPAWHLEWK